MLDARRSLLWGLTLALLACDPTAEIAPAARLGPSRAEADPAPSRPIPRRVLLVSLDTVRADHLGTYGYPRPTSPTIDALGGEGVVFEDVTSTAPWTLPANGSLLTGLYPARHGAKSVDWTLAQGLPTLATLLAGRGWATAAAVNVRFLDRRYGLVQGFERFLYVRESEDRVGPSTWITDQAIEWLRELGDRRAFLLVHYYDAHSDYAALPDYRRLFVSPYDGELDGSTGQLNLFRWVPERCRRAAEPAECRTAAGVYDASLPRIQIGAEDRRHLVDLYDANLRQLDAELGRLIDFLRQQELLEDTLIVLTADHGEEFLEHGGVLHSRTQYQEILAVPLILRGPGVPAGVRVSTPVSLVDVFPTVLALLGEQASVAPDGLDLRPLWQTPGPDDAVWRERHLFAEASFSPVANDVVVAVRQGRWKLIYNQATGKQELYDLARDPGEQIDLASREPDLALRLRDAVLGHRLEAVQSTQLELSEDEVAKLRDLGHLE